MFDCGVLVADLIGAELFNGGFKLRVAIAEFQGLGPIVLFDHFFNGGGASVSGGFAQQCGDCAEAEASQTP